MKKMYNVMETICSPKLNDNQNGITIISLVITIIVMLILTGVTIEVGTGSIENSKKVSFLAYMQTIQKKVDLIYEDNNYLEYGEALSNDNKARLKKVLNNGNESFITTVDSEYLRYFDSNHLASQLDIQNIDDEIVVDFNTREVISLTGIKYENKIYYSQYYLPGGQKINQPSGETNRAVSFGEIETNINGLNATFTIKGISITNGTLSYGKKDSSGVIKWKVVTNYTKKDVDITTENITESGTYYFKLVDNTNGNDNIGSDSSYPSVELRLTNAPKLKGDLTDLSRSYNYSDINDSTKWAYATDSTDTANVKYYVWIPRFVYKLDENNKLSELQFLRGTSDITTAGGYIKTSEWTEPTAFTSDTNKVTGVWVQIDESDKDKLDIIEILTAEATPE